MMAFLLFVDSDGYEESVVGFDHKMNHIAGTMILPKHRPQPFPVAIFVHGDGSMPYDAYGYYRPLWKQLAEKGIASFSWDKAGVGDSSGNWQSQSMDDRADEVIAAIEMLKKRKEIDPDKIGLIGYSQAGWVLPLVAGKSDYPDFMVLISGAVNWMDQSNYVTKTRLAQDGFSNAHIHKALANHATVDKVLADDPTYAEYLQHYNASHADLLKNSHGPMSAARFQFVKLNWHYDARNHLKEIECPTLAVFGEKDQNVDIIESIRVYEKEFSLSGNKDLMIKVFPSAQHSLLKYAYFNEIVPGIGFIIKLEILGNAAFAKGYLDFVANWVEEASNRI